MAKETPEEKQARLAREAAEKREKEKADALDSAQWAEEQAAIFKKQAAQRYQEWRALLKGTTPLKENPHREGSKKETRRVEQIKDDEQDA